ncbi:hypothetical protein HDV02_005992 [Globomyces sp. JEL0801]|nr:hypothetical protein HDV02_005992 [Globomyces sp. JEL0801]
MSYQTSSRPTNNQTVGNGNPEMTGLIVVISIFIAITFFITLLVFMYKRTARKVSPKKIVKQKMYSEDNSVASKESTVVEENMENGMEKPSLLYDSRLIIKKKLAGSGGCGAVYQANYSGVEAVAKIPRLEKHERLIYEEAQMMQKLKSPWVVNVLHFMGNTSIRIPNQDYIPQTALLIEFMNLGSFSKYLTTPNFHHDQPSEFTMTQYKSVLSQTHSLTLMAARGIEYLHSLGYNHLDIKPDNILLNQESDGKIIAKISDFGSTRLNGSSDCVFQTLAYIPPEGLPKSTEKPVVGLTGAPVNSEVVQSNVFVPNLALGSVSYLPSDFDPVPYDPTKIIVISIKLTF